MCLGAGMVYNPALAATIGKHDKKLRLSTPGRTEDYLPAIRRPGGTFIISGVTGQLCHLAALDINSIDVKMPAFHAVVGDTITAG